MDTLNDRISELHLFRELFLQQGVVLADYANSLGISERKLSKYINTTFNMSFKRWINTQRIEQVKQLVQKQPTLNMDEVAELSGFADKSQLSKTFQEITGGSFSAYRKK